MSLGNKEEGAWGIEEAVEEAVTAHFLKMAINNNLALRHQHACNELLCHAQGMQAGKRMVCFSYQF